MNQWENVRVEQELYYNSMAKDYMTWSRDRVDNRLSQSMRNDWELDTACVDTLRNTVLRHQRIIAEVGSGPSRLDGLNIQRLLCIDISLPMLYQARMRLKGTAHLINANSQAIPLADGAVDLVVCSELLSHMPDNLCLKSLSEMFRILRADGKSLLIDSVSPSTQSARIEGDVQWRKTKDGKELRVYKRYRSPNWFLKHFQPDAVQFYAGKLLFCIVWQKNRSNTRKNRNAKVRDNYS